MTSIFGAYIHFRPNGRIFYVGKGKEARALNLHPNMRGPHHARVVAKESRENIHVSFFPCESEKAAFALEIAMISRFRKMGEPLVNCTDGGEGTSGWVPSEETKAKMSAANMGQVFSEERRAKISAANKRRKLGPCSEEVRMKISAANKDKIISVETRAKLSVAQKSKTASDETKAKISAGLKRYHEVN